MHVVTHLDRVRAAIRSAWPTGIACPPLVVRFRAGSERAGWGTLVELARIRRQHPDDVVIDHLTRAAALDLVASSATREAAETTKYLIGGTLGILGGRPPARVDRRRGLSRRRGLTARAPRARAGEAPEPLGAGPQRPKPR